jgi:hypothetical protein
MFAFETLGLAGALRCSRLPGLLQTWTDHDKRPRSGEMIAPASLWRREDGFDPVVFSEIFPECRLPSTLIAMHVVVERSLPSSATSITPCQTLNLTRLPVSVFFNS